MSKRELLAAYRQRLADRQADKGESPPALSKPAATKKEKLREVAQKKRSSTKQGSFNDTAHPRAAAGSSNGGQFIAKKDAGSGSATPQHEVSPWKSSVTNLSGSNGTRQIEVNDGTRTRKLHLVSSRFEGAKGVDPDADLRGSWNSRRTLTGLTHNLNRMVRVGIPMDRKNQLTSQEQADLIHQHVLEHAKEGDIVSTQLDDLLESSSDAPKTKDQIGIGYVQPRTKELVAQGMSDQEAYDKAWDESDANRDEFTRQLPGFIARHPITKLLAPIDSEDGRNTTLVGVVRGGKLVPASQDDFDRAELGGQAREARREQVDKAIAFQRAVRRDPNGKVTEKYKREEDEATEKADKLDDKWMGRNPQPGVVKSVEHYKQKADEWAKSQGFDDGGVNGFTAEATKAHDLSHPVTHDLIGMDSKAIHEHFGSITQKGGTPSLLGEEAIVNVVEHLSRGDSLEASVISGMRVARVLSRNAGYETDEGRNYVRGDEFRDKLFDLADQVYKNDNFNEYMGIVRASNRVSGTVTMRGNDFTQTASGG